MFRGAKEMPASDEATEKAEAIMTSSQSNMRGHISELIPVAIDRGVLVTITG